MKRLSNGIVLNRELQRNNLPDCAADTLAASWPSLIIAILLKAVPILSPRNPAGSFVSPFSTGVLADHFFPVDFPLGRFPAHISSL